MIKGSFLNELVKGRFEGDFPMVGPDEYNYMDVARTRLYRWLR
jgi:DNA-directed RNA polymerase subunit beta